MEYGPVAEIQTYETHINDMVKRPSGIEVYQMGSQLLDGPTVNEGMITRVSWELVVPREKSRNYYGDCESNNELKREPRCRSIHKKHRCKEATARNQAALKNVP